MTADRTAARNNNDIDNTIDDTTIDLSTSVGGIPLWKTCIYNASGPRCGTSTALSMLSKHTCGSAAILCKSSTLLKQQGNVLPRTYHVTSDSTQNGSGQYSFNSEGLPNNGIDYYIDEDVVNEILGHHEEDEEENNGDNSTKNDTSKPYMISLSGKTLDDNLEMLRRISVSKTKHRISSIELNVACPNIIGKPIIGYDIDQLQHILREVTKLMKRRKSLTQIPLGIKLPPYLDLHQIHSVANIINQYKDVVKYIVSINTIGNTLIIDEFADMPIIAPNNGYAGLSGPAIKYTALANIREFRKHLHTGIDIVGVGGISTGHDVYNMLLCGACAVQIATTYWKEGTGCFKRINDELRTIMCIKGYKSIQNDVIGKLKSWTKDGATYSRQQQQIEKQKKVQRDLNQDDDKNSKEATTTSSSSLISELQFYQILSMILTILLAILCYEKWS